MLLDSNAWNRWRYTLWAPFYDHLGHWLVAQRRRSLELLDLSAGARVVLVGAGTGQDLPFLPPGVTVVATDLTPAMLWRARPHLRDRTALAVMDGQALALADAQFDAAVLHLILSVIPDPARCLAEVARVLRPGGRIAVFDKFVPDGARPALPRRLANLFTKPLFTDITRRLGDMLQASQAPLRLVHDEAGLFRGAYRLVILENGPVRAGTRP